MVKGYLLAGVVAAAVVWVSFASAGWAVAAGVVAPVLPLLMWRFAAGVWTGARTPSHFEDAAGRAEVMSGTQFEDYVATVARRCGLPVVMTPLSGDWGVDLIVGRRPNRLAVQCKRAARPVGPAAVQEVVAGAPMQDCAQTMVVTNNDFTPAARKLAELHGCHLIGGAQLPQLRALLRQAMSSPGPARPGPVSRFQPSLRRSPSEPRKGR